MAKTKSEKKSEAPKAEPTVLEMLLGKRADDAESDLDVEQVNRMCHVLRANCGEHGAALADVLMRTGKLPGAPAAKEPESEGTEVD